jgi:hypothetical protein
MMKRYTSALMLGALLAVALGGFAQAPAAPILLMARSGGSTPAGSGGDIAHGELFTINGSGFGTHADNNVDGYTWQGHQHLHFRYTTFENGAPANTASDASWMTATDGFAPESSYMLDDRVQVLSGGPGPEGFHARRRYLGTGTSPRLGGLSADISGAPVGGPLYSRMKFRRNTNWVNGKIWRSYYGTGDSYLTADALALLRENDVCGQWFAGPSPEAQGITIAADTWYDFEFLLKAGATASRILVENDAVTFDSSSIAATDQLPILCAADDPNTHTIDFPNMMDGFPDIEGAAPHTRYYDYAELVVDYTWERVLRCDASTWAVVTDCEFQPAITWSDTAVQVAINEGELALTPSWMYVIDGNNSVVNSSGVAVQ